MEKARIGPKINRGLQTDPSIILDEQQKPDTIFQTQSDCRFNFSKQCTLHL